MVDNIRHHSSLPQLLHSIWLEVMHFGPKGLLVLLLLDVVVPPHLEHSDLLVLIQESLGPVIPIVDDRQGLVLLPGEGKE